MKFLVEAQLPPALARWLREAGHEAQAVREVGLREAEDGDIWNDALKTGAIIVTKDEDFPQRATGPHLPGDRLAVHWQYFQSRVAAMAAAAVAANHRMD